MTAAYRMRGLGWFMAVVAVALGFYLVSLQVAAERKKLDDVNRAIAQTHHTLRQLQTEFDTRANLAQLERWNGTVLAMAAPNADQFMTDDTQLAMVDFRSGDGRATARPATYVVPALPVDADRTAPAAPPAAQALAAAPPPSSSAPDTAKPQAQPKATPRPAPIGPVMMADAAPRPVSKARLVPAAAAAHLQPVRRAATAVAMVSRRAADDRTLSDLLSRADIATESGR